MVKFDSWAIYQGDKLIPFKTVYDNWVSPSWIKHFVLKFSFQVKFEKKKPQGKASKWHHTFLIYHLLRYVKPVEYQNHASQVLNC